MFFACAKTRSALTQLISPDRMVYLVWFALGCAVLTFIMTCNLTSTISVIIIAGACGIAAGTPLAILAESGGQRVKGQSSRATIEENYAAIDGF
ncbi:MAG: hypothetical protein WAN14_25325 [Candidatus Acidiferrales bacterium]